MTRDEIDVLEKRIYEGHPECRLDNNAWWEARWDEGRKLMESAEQIKRLEATPFASAAVLDEQRKRLKLAYDKWQAEINNRQTAAQATSY
jgi:hypothetical protein